MAKKFSKDNPPKTLDDVMFYGLQLDELQKQFRDAIWNDNYNIVFCNAKAGTGKTTIATAVAILLKEYKKYEGILYVVSPYGEGKQGFLPGSIVQKSEVYFEPFYQALIKCQLDPIRCVMDDSLIANKNGEAFIKCFTDTYTRGTNFENKVVIIDEAQNFTISQMKKVLTRAFDSCKIIVIGHNEQCDLFNPKISGFLPYVKHFSTEDYSITCNLSINYRGKVSRHADELKELDYAQP